MAYNDSPHSLNCILYLLYCSECVLHIVCSICLVLLHINFLSGIRKIYLSINLTPPEDTWPIFVVSDSMPLFVLKVCKMLHLCLLYLYGVYRDECVLEPNKGFVIKERFLRATCTPWQALSDLYLAHAKGHMMLQLQYTTLTFPSQLHW